MTFCSVQSFPRLARLAQNKLIRLPAGTLRGFGGTKASSVSKVEEQAAEIKATLEGFYDIVEGIVFPHVSAEKVDSER